ncbi:MAG TPA: hypothetical protein VFN23_12950 [Ktedonobacteraceae bacterium]|nr:hypothetical protein [Ktedonobacteraceae bacterium]
MYYLFRLAAILVPRIPYRLIPPLSRVIGWFAWLLAFGARKQVEENITHILQARNSGAIVERREVQRKTQGVFCNSARNYLEAFYTPQRSEESIVSVAHIESIDPLKEALAHGHGVILFSAHLGPFELLAHWLSINGYRTIVPVENLKDKRLLDLMLRLRRSHGIEFIPLGGSAPMRVMTQALRANQIVLITADRVIQGQSIEFPFFGTKTQLPGGIVRLAQKTGAALVGGFGWWTDETHIQCKLVPLSLTFSEEELKQVEVVQQGIVNQMETFIGEHPEQWVVLSRIWTKN